MSNSVRTAGDNLIGATAAARRRLPTVVIGTLSMPGILTMYLLPLAYPRGSEPAVVASQRASERAVARGAMVEAERHYTPATERLGTMPDTGERDRRELGLQTAPGMVLWGTKGWSGGAPRLRSGARAG